MTTNSHDHKYSISKTEIEKGASILREGGTLVFPTETVYGLGANALNAEAVDKIFKAKGRPGDNPLIVHVATYDAVLELVNFTAKIQQTRLDKLKTLWPGPLSLVLPKKECVPDNVTAGLDTVAIRIPSHTTALRLLMEAACPVAAPSANFSGYVSPTNMAHVSELKDKVDYILCETEPCALGLESTVLDISQEQVKLLRPGHFTKKDLQKVLGEAVLSPLESDISLDASPGTKYKHYKPAAPMYTINELREMKLSPETTLAGLFFCSRTVPSLNYKYTRYLSQTGDNEEASKNFYDALRDLDAYNPDAIIIEGDFSEKSSDALKDRIQRALG